MCIRDSHKLVWAHKEALKRGITNSVASCTLMTELGESVYFSVGAETNIKLTTQDDLMIFKALLAVSYTHLNNYINSPVAVYKDELYNLPFNMNTFSKMWGVRTPAEAKAKIEEQVAALGITDPKNLEEQALSLVGTDVYNKLVKGYMEKQWGRQCKDLPAFIIKRVPCRFIYDNRCV